MEKKYKSKIVVSGTDLFVKLGKAVHLKSILNRVKIKLFCLLRWISVLTFVFAVLCRRFMLLVGAENLKKKTFFLLLHHVYVMTLKVTN